MEKKTTFISEHEELAYRQMEQKVELETVRYKQDCRKRALELAEKSLCESRNNGTFDVGVSDKDGKILTKEAAEDVYLIALADRYYNWLISIP